MLHYHLGPASLTPASTSLSVGLGGAVLTIDARRQKVSEQRYKPYGELRWTSGAGMPTDFTFTSQRAGPANYVGSLMDYVARGYSPALGRFVSADTIVPGSGNSQALNRYAYVLNSPLGRTDPDGHRPTDDGEQPCPPSLQGCGGSVDDAGTVRAASGLNEPEGSVVTVGRIEEGEREGANSTGSLRALNPFVPGGKAYERADKLLGLADRIPGASKLYRTLTGNGRITPRGAAFQTDRALAAAEDGRLVEIEPQIEYPGGKYGYPDHLETGDTLVDAKAWSPSTWKAGSAESRGRQTGQFGDQMRKYLSPDVNGKLYNVRVEFKEFIPDEVDPLLHALDESYRGRFTWKVVGP